MFFFKFQLTYSALLPFVISSNPLFPSTSTTCLPIHLPPFHWRTSVAEWRSGHSMPGVNKQAGISAMFNRNTLQGINISHLGKRKIIFKMPFWGDMLVPWRVYFFNQRVHFKSQLCYFWGGVITPWWKKMGGVLTVCWFVVSSFWKGHRPESETKTAESETKFLKQLLFFGFCGRLFFVLGFSGFNFFQSYLFNPRGACESSKASQEFFHSPDGNLIWSCLKYQTCAPAR